MALARACAREEDDNVAAQNTRRPSLAGQALKRYREYHRLTQEQLAETLKIEPRTLRAYENGERQLNQITELRRIANALAFAPEQLGLAAAPRETRTPEQINERLARAWRLTVEPHLDAAWFVIEALMPSVRAQVDDAPVTQEIASSHPVGSARKRTQPAKKEGYRVFLLDLIQLHTNNRQNTSPYCSMRD